MSNYGLQLMLRISKIQNKEVLNDAGFIARLLVDLVGRIGMRVLAGPLTGIEGGEPEKQGCSGIIILYESHAAIHTYSYLGEAFVDIFSCKAFDPADVVLFLRETLGDLEITEEKIVDRGRDWSRNIAKEFGDWAGER